MAIKGGYKLIDLKNNKFTVGGNGITIAGIYNSIKASYNKPLILTNINIGGVERNDIFVDFVDDSGSYVANISSKETIKITNADLVTIKAIATE